MSARFDLLAGHFELGRARRDGGALVLDATPAPYDVVFSYGATDRELRTRADVTDAKSLASWSGVPLVLGHPMMLATKSDAEELAIGYVRRAHDGGDGWLHAEIVVLDGDAIAAIESGDLAELSGGYTVDVIGERGAWRGETYDGVQKNIRMNHLGIGPRGWARGGANAKVL